MSLLTARPYLPTDRDSCLQIFDSNAPTYFAPAERPAFERFLARTDTPYFVVESHSSEIVGCGGLRQSRDDAAVVVLRWGMVSLYLHRAGIGRFLLATRLKYVIETMPAVTTAVLFTTSRVAGFYERLGFVATDNSPDHYGRGLHQVRFERRIEGSLAADVSRWLDR